MLNKKLHNLVGSKNLRARLVLYFLSFSIIPLIFLGTVSYLWSSSALKNNMDSFSEKLILQSLDYLDYEFKQVERSVAIVSKTETVRNALDQSNSETKLKKLFDDYVQSGSGINNIYLGTVDGRLYSRLDLSTDIDILKQDWYIKGMENKTGEFVWTDTHQSIFNQSMVITLVKYITNLSGEPVGVLAADVDIYELAKSMANIKLGESGFMMLVDNADNVVGGPGKYIKSKYNRSLLEEIRTAGNYLFKEAQYENINWKIVGVIPKHEIENSSGRIWWLFVALAVFSLTMSIVFAGRYATQISHPILRLKDLMLKGAAGDLDIQYDKSKLTNSSIKEISEMANAFNKMILTLNVLKQSLEIKIEQKTKMTEELKEVNEELNAQQEELMILNENLAGANQRLEKTNKELMETQAKLVQSEKMASLGMLVAGIAHEINTPLGAINCNIDLYKTILSKLKSLESVKDDGRIFELVCKMDDVNNTNLIASDRIMDIVKSLKNFARLDEAEYKDADIHEGIDSTLVLLNNKIKNKVEIIKEYGKIPEIYCYPNQLNQVFMNLFNNAIHAVSEKGKIWIKTYSQDDKVYIKVIDNGVGIKPEHINRIFDPGFTTKGVGVGTGLGLSIVFNIIEKHEGKISVTSEVGKGTEFTIELPVNKELKEAK